MPDPFLDPILERLARSQGTIARLGHVTEIDEDDASLTVDCAGDVIVGVRWYQHYTPTVGDLVDVLCVGGSSWRVLGKLSKQLGAPELVYGSVLVAPTSVVNGYRTGSGYGWSAVLGSAFEQGRRGVELEQGAVLYYPVPTSQIPEGAAVESATIRFNRVRHWTGDSGPVLARPRVYQHAYTGGGVPPGGGAPSWVGSVWSPGSLANNESATWDLPSDWVSAWVAGTTTGFGVWSASSNDWAVFDTVGGRVSGLVNLNYSMPAP